MIIFGKKSTETGRLQREKLLIDTGKLEEN
jgi:hypothetical protein